MTCEFHKNEDLPYCPQCLADQWRARYEQKRAQAALGESYRAEAVKLAVDLAETQQVVETLRDAIQALSGFAKRAAPRARFWSDDWPKYERFIAETKPTKGGGQ